MRTYENDTDIKIPNWYLRLPQKVLNTISDIGLWVNRVFLRPRKDSHKRMHGGRNVKFYL